MLLIGKGLKGELSESQLSFSQFHQTVEHRCGVAEASREVLVDPMKDFLEMINDRYDAEDPLHDHAIIAFAMLTKPPVDGLFATLAEAQITEDFTAVGPSLTNTAKVLVMGIGGGPSPVDDLSLRRDQPTELDADNPAMIAFPFLAHLGLTASLTNRVDQLDAVAINHALGLGSNQELIG